MLEGCDAADRECLDKNKAGNSEVDRLRAARLCNRPAQRVRFVGDRFLRHGG